MGEVNWSELRERMRKFDYPVNHSFDPETLKPNTDVARSRVNEIVAFSEEIINEYRDSDPLLDVGCNKGLFSFLARNNYRSIVGIDINPDMIRLANDIRDAQGIKNIFFNVSSFENFLNTEQFIVVHFGQCSHYLFRDAFRRGENPLSFLEKAKRLAKKYIAIDGAFDGDSSVEFDAVTDKWPADVKKLATIEGYAGQLRPEFRLIRYNWSGGSSTRYMAIFERI
jgi:SAM-dependent methyltransferase